MALPSNKIKKVKLPNNTEYDIVPTMLQDGTTSYKLSVPTLTADSNIAIDSNVVHKTGNETISNVKTFSDGIKVGGVQDDKVSINTNQNTLEIYEVDADESISIQFNSVYNDIYSSNSLRVFPAVLFNSTVSFDNEISVNNTAYFEYFDETPIHIGYDKTTSSDGFLSIYDQSTENNASLDLTSLTASRSYTFPDQSGTIAMTSDIVNVEIVDLTSISSGS